MFKARRIRVAVTIAALGSLLAVGCSSSSKSSTPRAAPTATATAATGPTPAPAALDALVTKAKAEGQLTLYSAHTEEKNTALATEFEKTYGIKVNHVPRASGNGLTDRYQAERTAGGSPADVFINTSHLIWDDLAKKGLLTKLDSTTVPVLANYPKTFFSDNFLTFSVGAFVVCYNTAVLKDGDLTDWKSVLLPKTGKLGIPAMAPDAYWSTWDQVRMSVGIDTIKEAGKKSPVFSPTSPAGMQLLGSGETSVFFPCAQATVAPIQKAGAPVGVKVIYPVSGVEFQAAIASSSPHPNAARLFLNWLGTKEGQAVANNSGAGASPLVPAGDPAATVLPMPSASGYVSPEPGKVVNYKEIEDALGFKA